MPETLTAAAHGITTGHARWVRISHWIVAASLATLAFSGVVILMAHPRLYWGDAGNDLTPALVELPIVSSYRHDGYDKATPFFENAASPVSASRNYSPFNQNGWGRSLHFLAAWLLVVPGLIYLVAGFFSGHFRSNLWPRLAEMSPTRLRREVVDHLRLRIRTATGGPQYGLLQKCSYCAVVFVLFPVVVLSGLTMSPAVTAGYPFLLDVFGGFQSARTIHFFTFVLLMLFVLAHVFLVVKSGFKRQIRAMTLGD